MTSSVDFHGGDVNLTDPRPLRFMANLIALRVLNRLEQEHDFHAGGSRTRVHATIHQAVTSALEDLATADVRLG
jgi:hypothetical protein